MIIQGVVCNQCGNTLPPHTDGEHLDENHPIHKCPHIHDIDLREEDEGNNP